MSSGLKLTYFNFPGRGEIARMAFRAGGVKFEDNRISFEEFGRLKPSLPFGNVPVLEIEGEKAKYITQSSAIARFAAKKSNIVPENPLDELKVDELLATVEDIIVATFRSDKEEDRKALVAADGRATRLFTGVEEKIKLYSAPASKFAIGDSLTLADLGIFVVVNFYHNGIVQHIPKNSVNRENYPNLFRVYETVKNDPRFQQQ